MDQLSSTARILAPISTLGMCLLIANAVVRWAASS